MQQDAKDATRTTQKPGQKTMSEGSDHECACVCQPDAVDAIAGSVLRNNHHQAEALAHTT